MPPCRRRELFCRAAAAADDVGGNPWREPYRNLVVVIICLAIPSPRVLAAEEAIMAMEAAGMNILMDFGFWVEYCCFNLYHNGTVPTWAIQEKKVS